MNPRSSNQVHSPLVLCVAHTGSRKDSKAAFSAHTKGISEM